MWINNKNGNIAGGEEENFRNREFKTETIQPRKGMLMKTEKITFRIRLVKVFFRGVIAENVLVARKYMRRF